MYDYDTYPNGLPVGTTLWSNPGNGSGVWKIVPAVPSPTGVADVFAFQTDGTVQAITSEGVTAWTASLGGYADAVPDFQGGLVVWDLQAKTIYKLNGIDGSPNTAYSFGEGSLEGRVVVHTDGTILAMQRAETGVISVIGINPGTGTSTINVPLEAPTSSAFLEVRGDIMIAGDGYAYVPYRYR